MSVLDPLVGKKWGKDFFRLFKVSLFRAKELLYLTVPSYLSSWGANFTLPSRFLVEVSEDTYEVLI